ncbi:leukocyte receptor cluster member 9 [Anaeramoeba flamelloides]|uniref:Leukocyte receptor cluster member 9 n=1 Tax=Anaeramoeba flamelloides TaxID=1746091 RepID=A0ABQ8YKY1_9EUKA|nr:leukocyte receptor cluster member 9 [Anaeramoeba flamelloides]
MKTSKDVYNRIIYDNKYDTENFLIGMKEGSDIIDCPFDEYDPEEVPMHSILYFKQNEQIVWSRNPQVDLIFGSLTKRRQKEIEEEQRILNNPRLLKQRMKQQRIQEQKKKKSQPKKNKKN